MTRRWDSYIVMSVAVGMTLACGAWLYQPGQRELSTLLASAQAMRDQLARGSSTFSDLTGVRTDVRNANDLLADYRTQISPSPNVGTFIEEVSAIASRLGLRNRTIVPQAPRAYGTIVMLPIEISFESAFDKSFDFLRSVERLARAVQIAVFAVKRVDEEEGFSPHRETLLRTELTLRVFYEAT